MDSLRYARDTSSELQLHTGRPRASASGCGSCSSLHGRRRLVDKHVQPAEKLSKLLLPQASVKSWTCFCLSQAAALWMLLCSLSASCIWSYKSDASAAILQYDRFQLSSFSTPQADSSSAARHAAAQPAMQPPHDQYGTASQLSTQGRAHIIQAFAPKQVLVLRGQQDALDSVRIIRIVAGGI